MDKTKHAPDCVCAWCEVDRQGTMNTSRIAAESGSPALPACDNCFKRPGKLTHQFAHGPCGHHGEVPRFVFRAHHCQWCLAAENRRLKRDGKPLWRYLEHKPDAEILEENNQKP
jgi:hypothetical protein